jgi:hypothetical protein
MDGIRPGACMLWKPAGGGVSALVTIMALDLEKDRALIHVRRATTGECREHWVDMAALSPAAPDARPCGCAVKSAAPQGDPNAA